MTYKVGTMTSQPVLNRIILMMSVLVAHTNLVICGNPRVNKTRLVESLRRQLMENNYDYVPSEEELLTAAQTHHYDQDPPNDPLDNENDTLWDSKESKESLGYKEYKEFKTDVKPHKPDKDDAANKSDRAKRTDRADELFVPRAHEDEDDDDDNDSKPKHVIAKKDLLYYMDDNRLVTPTDDEVVEINDELYDDVSMTSTAKYKLIQVRNQNPSRRSNSARRIVQEQTEDGVAMISLDGKPFPEFRLPGARRQYMREESEKKDSSEDVAVELD